MGGFLSPRGSLNQGLPDYTALFETRVCENHRYDVDCFLICFEPSLFSQSFFFRLLFSAPNGDKQRPATWPVTALSKSARTSLGGNCAPWRPDAGEVGGPPSKLFGCWCETCHNTGHVTGSQNKKS